MGVDAEVAVSQGDVMRQLRELRKLVERLYADRRMESGSVGAGGLRFYDGGSARFVDGGDVQINDGGDLIVNDGGDVTVNDGGTLRARYTDGSTAAMFGSLKEQETGESSGHGLLVQDDEAGDRHDIFRAKRDTDGQKFVFVGSSVDGVAKPVAELLARSEQVNLQTYADDQTDTDAPETRISQSTSVNVESGNQINLRTPNGAAVRVDAVSTGNSANAVILTPNGTIGISTSARRHKTSIEDYAADQAAVLALRPRTWRDTADVERAPEVEAWHVGLVAEEVDALGLAEFVDYDENGEPERVTYDRLCVALLQVVRAQEERLAVLESAAGISPPPQAAATRKPKRRPVPGRPDDVDDRDRPGESRSGRG